MTKEDKEIFIIDLCARLANGVNIQVYDPNSPLDERIIEGVVGGYAKGDMCQDFSIDDVCEFIDSGATVKMYLRPLSSITDEEEDEFKQVLEIELKHLESEESGHTIIGAAASAFEIDFYNKHRLDYRGWIEKGFAIKAPEKMYK